jgi:hypothetical protein
MAKPSRQPPTWCHDMGADKLTSDNFVSFRFGDAGSVPNNGIDDQRR